MASDIASSRLRARSFSGSCSMPAAASSPPLESPFLVALDVVLEVNAGLERPVGLLRLVLEVDLGERQSHILGVASVTRVAMCHACDDDIAHLDDEELLLALARLAMGDRRFLQVHTG